MNIADAWRFRLLNVAKQILFTKHWFSCQLSRFGLLKGNKHLYCPDFSLPIDLRSDSRPVVRRFVPHTGELIASVLLFHGIGDKLHFWQLAQQRLADAGISSCIFALPGYAKQGGPASRAHMEQDAITSYGWLVSQLPPHTPIFLLGFSLGSGLAAQVASCLSPPPTGVILLEAFTSLRQAAIRAARPLSVLGYLIPDVWKTEENVAAMTMPLFLIHSHEDRLFPAAMAEQLLAAAHRGGVTAELALFRDYAHDAPYSSVPPDYWAAIVAFIKRTAISHGG